jgi:uncharacterized protein
VTIDLRRHAAGTILPVKAQAGARRTALLGIHNGMVKVSVMAAPEKGKANARIVELLCQTLSLTRSQVELLCGATSPSKQFLIRGVSLEELARRIAAALE